MEGLCNQVDPGVGWELIIAEEKENAFGQDRVSEYAERLAAAGCERIMYYSLDYKITLPAKWRFLAQKSAKTSEGFILQAADCYSEPNRLCSTMEAIRAGHDWVQNRTGYYYSIHYKMVIKFDQSKFGIGCKTGLNMATLTRKVRALPDSFIESGIDNWMYRCIEPQSPGWIEGDMTGGIDTDDLNNISLARRFQYHNPSPPFIETERELADIIPKDIADRLDKTKPRWS